MQDIPFEFAFDVSKINAELLENPKGIIQRSENSIEREVERTAEEIISAGEKLKIRVRKDYICKKGMQKSP